MCISRCSVLLTVQLWQRPAPGVYPFRTIYLGSAVVLLTLWATKEGGTVRVSLLQVLGNGPGVVHPFAILVGVHNHGNLCINITLLQGIDRILQGIDRIPLSTSPFILEIVDLG